MEYLRNLFYQLKGTKRSTNTHSSPKTGVQRAIYTIKKSLGLNGKKYSAKFSYKIEYQRNLFCYLSGIRNNVV
jgi:hypothetical protein